jgi:hypothetical protein
MDPKLPWSNELFDRVNIVTGHLYARPQPSRSCMIFDAITRTCALPSLHPLLPDLPILRILDAGDFSCRVGSSSYGDAGRNYK